MGEKTGLEYNESLHTMKPRIVAKVGALMRLCDSLESRLIERAAVQERFAKAVATGGLRRDLDLPQSPDK